MERLQEEGASSAQVIGVLNDSFDRFAGASKDLAGTLPGVISTFKDNITLGLAEAFEGKPLEQFKVGILGIGETISNLIASAAPDLAALTGVLADTFGGSLEALAPAIEAALGLLLELAEVGGGVLVQSLEIAAPLITVTANSLTALLDVLEPLTPAISAAAVAWGTYKTASAIGDATKIGASSLLGLADNALLAKAPIEGIAGGMTKLGSILPQIGLAVGIGTAAWALFANQEKEVIDVNDDLIASLGEVGDTLTAEQINKIAEALGETKNAGEDAGKRFLELAQSGKITGANLVEAFGGSKKAAQELARELEAASKIEITPAFTGLDQQTKGVQRVFAELSDEIATFAIATGQGFGDDFIKASELPAKLRAQIAELSGLQEDSLGFKQLQFDVKGPDAGTLGAISDLIGDAQELAAVENDAAEASAALAGDLALVTESATSATDQMDKFATLIEEQFGQLDVTEQLQDLQRAFADFQIVDDENNPITTFAGQLGGLDDVSRNATDALNELIDKSQQSIQTAIESGQPLTDVIGKYDFLRESILKTAEANGIARDEVEDYLDVVGFVPDEVTTLLTADAADGKIIVDEWAAIIANLPPQKQTEILAVLNEEQRAAVQRKLDDLSKPKTVQVSVIANIAAKIADNLLNPFTLQAKGDFFPGRPGGYPVIVGEAGPEVVIPLSDPARARQLVDESGLLQVLANDRATTNTTGQFSTATNTASTATVGGATFNFNIQSTDPVLAAREIEAAVESVIARSGLPVGV